MTEESAWGRWCEDLCTKLIVEMPELEEAYRKSLKLPGSPRTGVHGIIENVLRHHIINLLTSGADPEALRRAFGFVEAMCRDKDGRVREVAKKAVLERLEAVGEWGSPWEPYLGPSSKGAVKELTEERLRLYHRSCGMLLDFIPSLEDAYQKELAEWEGEMPGAHNVFAEVLNPYIRKLLETGDDLEAIKSAFDLVEAMCADENEYVQEVAVVTVLEGLEWNPDWRESMMPFVGPLTKEALDEMVRWREKPLEF